MKAEQDRVAKFMERLHNGLRLSVISALQELCSKNQELRSRLAELDASYQAPQLSEQAQSSFNSSRKFNMHHQFKHWDRKDSCCWGKGWGRLPTLTAEVAEEEPKTLSPQQV